MKFCLTLLIALFFNVDLNSQLTVEQIIEKSIAFHDPEDVLRTKKVSMTFNESRPSGSDRHSFVVLHPRKEHYKIERTADGNKTTMIADGNSSRFMLNDSEEVSAEMKQKFRLTSERLDMMSSYYRYLWHLPITLNDPGTIIGEEYKRTDFFGKECLEIRVTYDPKVGSDIWYFYFNPENYALEGYRFYHDENANDGEYILISELIEIENLKIPKVRKWYTHKEDKFLGADELVKIEID